MKNAKWPADQLGFVTKSIMLGFSHTLEMQYFPKLSMMVVD